MANICLHKLTNNKIYLFVAADRDLFDKIRKDMTGGHCIVLNRKPVVNETFI